MKAAEDNRDDTEAMAPSSTVVETEPHEADGAPPTITLAAAAPRPPASGYEESEPKEEASRLASLIGSPRGVMILVPLLVLAVGATLTVIGQIALSATSNKMAQERFVEHTTTVSLRLEHALGQAEPILEELKRIATTAERLPSDENLLTELTPVALEMHDLLIGRQAITQAYIAFPDGRFLSADPAGPGDVAFQITHSGASTSYRVHGQTLLEKEKRESNYDPRKRDWYRLAESKRNRVWSDPYAFYFNQHPGVTRAMPIYRDQERTKLLAVVGVDFDVHALTDFMASGESESDTVRSVVFTLGGVILAYPSGADTLAKLPKTKEVPAHTALGDPALSDLIRSVQGLKEKSQTLLDYRSQDQKMLASVRHMGQGGPDWYVATFSVKRTLLHELYEHRKRSLWIGTLALLIATAIGWLLARHVLFVRKVATEAREAAKKAHDQIRDLGSYRLISRIGEGGMGQVWRARHRLLARQAAIKLIKKGPDDETHGEEHRERFRREAQAIASLRSRNTVALFDYGVTSDGTLFYVMELLDGIDLSTLVTRHGKQPAERVRQIMLQACYSLQEAHEAGLVHRDIKPANLFLCREAREVDIVKVLDFGLVFQKGLPEVHASQLGPNDSTLSLDQGSVLTATDVDPAGRITRPEHQLGTPAFMSPEQALGEETDGRSDLYSLACVCWWLLTGQPVFHANTQLALMLKHIEEQLPDIEEAGAQNLDPRFRSLLEQCLKKAPHERPQSAADLGELLKALGPLEPGWSTEKAQSWWVENLATNPDFKPNLSLPPLRDADVLPPA